MLKKKLIYIYIYICIFIYEINIHKILLEKLILTNQQDIFFL